MRVILIFSFFINAYIFGQNTYFVDVNGNNNNSGAILNPFKIYYICSLFRISLNKNKQINDDFNTVLYSL